MKITKKSKLLVWIQSRPYVTSYQVKRHGIEVLSLYDAYRRCCEWVEDGILERLTDEMKKVNGINKKYAAWRKA